MKFNRLESEFFELLGAELDVPVHASLIYKDETFDVIIVPDVYEDGYFRLKYYNAPAYEPEPQINENDKVVTSYTISEAFGIHPSLERAWLQSDPITIQIRPSPLPIIPRTYPKLPARVLYASHHHRGALGLDRNQVTIQESPLKQAKFCIVEFPVVHDVILDSGNGWTIKLTTDNQKTRDLIGHTGLIEKSDGGDFGTDELRDMLEGLQYFLAFVLGAYCHPTVIIGYDSKNRRVWGKIGKFTTGHRRLSNWSNNEMLREDAAIKVLFPKFWSKWLSNKDAMIAVIECYVHSNEMRKAGLPKDAVAKSYSGLEILASLSLQKTIRHDSSEDIYKVLSDYKIPHLLLRRDETPTTVKLSETLGQSSMKRPFLLGSVRNYVAHPLDLNRPAEMKKKYLKYLDADHSHCFYLHDLSQFYLEYALLKFLGFDASNSYRPLLEAIQQP